MENKEVIILYLSSLRTIFIIDPVAAFELGTLEKAEPLSQTP
jgi:hypothetical protein